MASNAARRRFARGRIRPCGGWLTTFPYCPLMRQLATLGMQEDVQGYLAALRSRYKVEINKAALEAKER